MSTLSSELADRQQQLLDRLRALESCLVAFSGGVDSAVVAKAAHMALASRAIAVTGVSPSLASGELEIARQVAAEIGIRHEIAATSEGSKPEYQQNNFDRCFHCKNDLYTHLHRMREEMQFAAIINGANADDLGDYRPGMRAAEQHTVHSPLAECGLTKSDVRALAHHWNLAVADKPAMPCLASRVAYGEEVTPQRMAMIDRAEHFLRERGLSTCRVRYHRGDLARIEVPITAISQLCESPLREELVARFEALGFRFIAIDLAGFRSGSLNVLAVEAVARNVFSGS